MPVSAQMLITSGEYKVVKVDTEKMRIEVCRPDKNETQTYVLISTETRCYHENKLVPWTEIKKDTIIRVEGGMTWDIKIKAKTIWF